jgi:hypothetical protein
LDEDQAVILTANSYLETGAGATVSGHNYGGIKAKPKNLTGRQWCRAVGHVNSGDPPEVYYLVLASVDDYAKLSLETYAPKPVPSDLDKWPTVPTTSGDYRPAGLSFWRVGNRSPFEWYDKIVEAGYKGEVTKTDPARRASSNRQFITVTDTVRRYYRDPLMSSDLRNLQSALKLLGYYTGPIDGVIGTNSIIALKNFEKSAWLDYTQSDLIVSLTNRRVLLTAISLTRPT